MATARKFVTVTVSGFSLGGGVDVYKGDVLELPAKEADVKIGAEMVRDSLPDEVAAFIAKREGRSLEADADEKTGGKKK